MPQELYCWRCDMVIPMLDEKEWAEIIEPVLALAISDLQQRRVTHGETLPEAMQHGFGERALKLYQELTGFHETNVNAIRHHRLSFYGPPCKKCKKPLHTPEAKLCAACGAERD